MDESEKILKQFLAEATPEELEELNRLLAARKKHVSGIDAGAIAKKMARDMHEQMGLVSANMAKTARDLVISIALQHNPDLTDEELNAIANEMVPPKNQTSIPLPLLRTMVRQFVAYSHGSMDASFLRNQPEGWVQKYWEAFPEMVQKLIAAHLKGEVNSVEFDLALDAVIQGLER